MVGTIWEERSATHLPSLEGKLTADICVVGLGGAGLAAITELIAQGINVVGVDARSIGGGAAGRNAGFLLGGLADFFDEVVARFGSAIAAGIYRHTLEEIDRMLAEFTDLVTRTGSLRIADTEDEIAACEVHSRALNAQQISAEIYSGPEGTGVLIPSDARFHPWRCLQVQAARLRAQGVRLFERSAVTAIAPGVVTTIDGVITCDAVIAAIDGGLECLFEELKPRVRTARLQMLATAPAHDVSIPRPVYRRHGYDYWQQLPSGEILLGGFRDQGGEAEWTTDATAGGVVQELLEGFLRTYLKTSAAITHRWAGCVAYTPDRLPILEPIRERVYAVGAYSGTGNVVSRLCGRAVARLAVGKKSEWSELLSSARTHAAQRAEVYPMK